MSLTHCPIHEVPWKTIPAGVSSKTGVAYESFRACPEGGCRERPPRSPRRAAQESMPTPARTVSAATPTRTTPPELRLRAAIAACQAAGIRYQGVGFGADNNYDGAPDLALRFYKLMTQAMDGSLDDPDNVPSFD